MNTLLWNAALALAWGAVNGDFSLGTLTVGFAIGFVILLAAQPIFGYTHYVWRAARILAFAAFFVWELLQANVTIAIDVLSPRLRARPGVVAIPLADLTAVQITLLANLITLTPGTLSLDVSDDRKTLYIHAMHGVDDPQALAAAIKRGFERRVLEVTK